MSCDRPAGEDPRPAVVLLGQVANRLEALDGDHDPAEDQQHFGQVPVEHRRQVQAAAEEVLAVAEEERAAENRGQRQHGAERQSLEQVEAGKPAKDHRRDRQHGAAGHRPLGELGPDAAYSTTFSDMIRK